MKLFEWFKGSNKQSKPNLEPAKKNFQKEPVLKKAIEVVSRKERAGVLEVGIKELLTQTELLLEEQGTEQQKRDLYRLSHILLADPNQQEKEKECLLAFGYYLSKRKENSYNDRYYRNLQNSYFRVREALKANLSTVYSLYETYKEVGLDEKYYLVVNDVVCFFKESYFLNYLALDQVFSKLGMEPDDDKNSYDENLYTLSFYEIKNSSMHEVLHNYRQSEPLISKQGNRKCLLDFMAHFLERSRQMNAHQHR